MYVPTCGMSNDMPTAPLKISLFISLPLLLTSEFLRHQSSLIAKTLRTADCRLTACENEASSISRWKTPVDICVTQSLPKTLPNHLKLLSCKGPARPKFGNRPSEVSLSCRQGLAAVTESSISAYIHFCTSEYKGVKHPSAIN